MGEEAQGTSFREGAARSINGGRKGHILVNCFRSWFTHSSSDSSKAHVLGECQPRGSISYDSLDP